MRLCFHEPDAPIADRASSTEKGHGRITRRTCRTSQILHGYTDFPGFRQAAEEKRRVTDLTTGEIREETAYSIFSLSPREADAFTCMRLGRRHWNIENKGNHVRDDSWREDRQVWRRGHAAYVMSMLLSIALNLVRARCLHWDERTPLTTRAAVLNDLTLTPQNLLRRAS